MTFVSERIREEDKEYFNSIGFTQLAVNKPVRPFWWVIDREKEIILTSRGGVFAEPIEGYQIYYMKEFINIELVEQGSGDYFKKNIKTIYEINKIEIPQKLMLEGCTVDEIRQMVIDMFMEAGTFGYEKAVTISTVVNINEEPVIV